MYEFELVLEIVLVSFAIISVFYLRTPNGLSLGHSTAEAKKMGNINSSFNTNGTN